MPLRRLNAQNFTFAWREHNFENALLLLCFRFQVLWMLDLFNIDFNNRLFMTFSFQACITKPTYRRHIPVSPSLRRLLLFLLNSWFSVQTKNWRKSWRDHQNLSHCVVIAVRQPNSISLYGSDIIDSASLIFSMQAKPGKTNIRPFARKKHLSDESAGNTSVTSLM